jgi:hypothetical protein
METAYSFETMVDFQRTTRRYIAKGKTLHNHCFENLKPDKAFLVFWCRTSSKGTEAEINGS